MISKKNKTINIFFANASISISVMNIQYVFKIFFILQIVPPYSLSLDGRGLPASGGAEGDQGQG